MEIARKVFENIATSLIQVAKRGCCTVSADAIRTLVKAGATVDFSNNEELCRGRYVTSVVFKGMAFLYYGTEPLELDSEPVSVDAMRSSTGNQTAGLEAR